MMMMHGLRISRVDFRMRALADPSQDLVHFVPKVTSQCKGRLVLVPKKLPCLVKNSMGR